MAAGKLNSVYANLSGLTDACIASKTLFLGVSVRVPPEQFSNSVNRHGWESNPRRVWIELEGRERVNFLELGHPPSLALGCQYFRFLHVGLRPGLLPLPFWFSGLWTECCCKRVFPGGTSDITCLSMQQTCEMWVWSLNWEGTLEESMATHCQAAVCWVA